MFSSVQLLSSVQLFATPWTAAHQASPSLTICWSLPKFMATETVMPSNHLILCHPLPPLPSIFPSIRVFSNELALCIRWPKYWTFSISLSNEYSRFISLRIDWFVLLAVHGTVKNLQSVYNNHLVGGGICGIIVVLEKTLESPLDCKEIKPVKY